MRVKKDYRTASIENYNIFCSLYPEIKIPFIEWAGIIYAFNYAFRDYILETGEKVKMPWGFGDFMIHKKKKNRYKTLPDGTERINLSINWKATRQSGKLIYHTNLHTSGYNFYWRWENTFARFAQKDIWNFKASRETKRLLPHYLKKEGYQYIYKEWGR